IVAGSTHVPDDSHDRPPRGLRIGISVRQTLSDRVFARPELVGKSLVDQKHLLAVASVLLAQLASREKRNPHRAKITRPHKIDRSLHSLRSGKRRPPFYREVRRAGERSDEYRGRGPGSLDSRQSLRPLDQLPVECRSLRSLVPRTRKLKVHRHEVILLEAEI